MKESEKMSSKYIVRQPMKDAQSNIVGYDIQYYGENYAFGGSTESLSNTADLVAADTVYGFLTQNQDKHFSGSLNFMTFTSTLLVKKTPLLFDVNDLVIQIDDSVLIHPLAMHMVKQYAESNYKIAVNDFQFTPRYMAFMNHIDFIRINIETTVDETVDHLLEIAKSMDKKCIAYGIDTEALYDRVKEKPFFAFEGAFVAKKIATKAHNSEYLKSNFFRLMVAVTQEVPDVDEIEEIISLDATLTYAILKVVNSVYFALRKRVTTVRQAIMTMGLTEMKQWVYLISATNGDVESADDAAQEFLRLSFTRASFCTKLVKHIKGAVLNRQEAYLMGMLSTLNYLIDAPLVEILEEIPISDEIKEALLEKKGKYGAMYALILCYENADWANLDLYANELNIASEVLTTTYFECVEEAERTWREIVSPMEEPALTV